MKKLKRGLALLLSLMMLVTTLPAAAMAADEDPGYPATMDDVVQYNIGGGFVAVVWPECREYYEPYVDGELMTGVDTFAADGSYTIQLPEGTAFPCQVAFQWPDADTLEDEPIVVFDSVDDVHEIAGHAFSVACENPAYNEDGQPDEVDFNAGVNPLGLAYIQTIKKAEVNLSSYLKEELAVLPISKLLPGVDLTNISALAYDTSSNGNGNGEYTVVKTDGGTIDLSDLISAYSGRTNGELNKDRTYRMEIIGSDDQLDTSAKRYIVPVRISNLAALISLEAYQSDGTRLDTANAWTVREDSSNKQCVNYFMDTDLPMWEVEKAKISMKLNTAMPSASGLTARVYDGFYETAEDAASSGTDITDQIWSKGANGYVANWSSHSLTVVFTRGGSVVQVLNVPVILRDGMDFGFDLATAPTDGSASEKISVGNVYKSTSSRETQYNLSPADHTKWQSGNASLKLRYKTTADGWYDGYSGYYGDPSPDYSIYTDKTDVTVYTGYYETTEELDTAKAANKTTEVTDQIWNGSGYVADYTNWSNQQSFTVVIKEKGSDVPYVYPFYVHLYPDQTGTVTLQPSSPLTLWADSSAPGYVSNWNRASENMMVDTLDTHTTYYYTMRYTDVDEVKAGHVYPTDGTYYLPLYLTGTAEDISKQVDKVVKGTDKNGTDITASLTSYTPIQIDFKNQPVVFTLFRKDGTSQEIRLRTVAAKPLTDEPSKDTYFNVEGVKGYDTYVMAPHVDSSYQNGFQVIFVDTDKATLESGDITIEYSTGSGVNMFKEHNEYGQHILTEEITIPKEDFQSGKPVLFSAASESGTHLRNYWVTFVAREPGGPKLWINGQYDEDHWDQASAMSSREMFIYQSGGYHDILFANIGDEQLSNLEVTLTSSNGNIRLDDYWTIKDDGVKTLAPFTTTKIHQTGGQDDPYSELDNMAKIRIWAEGRGDVDGVLTISADGQQLSRIKLSGKVGQAAILSNKVPQGVKYVPYSCLIQTNYAGRTGNDADRPTFSIVGGVLPANVTINANTGEIYGVPRSFGTFYFTVGISQNGQMVDSKSFVMEILDNTDVNVWEASDVTYKVEDYIGLESGGQYHYVIDLRDPDYNRETNRTFVSEGQYIYYRKVFLDSVELVEGVDYTSDEGSTKIVLNENVLGRSGNNTNGTHTLAIEFRESDDKQQKDEAGYPGTLKRTSQNYTIEGGVNPSTNNGQNNNSWPSDDTPAPAPNPGTPSSNPSNNQNPSNQTPSTPNDTSTTTPPAENSSSLPFSDVQPGQWFYNDVLWAWENDLMNGVADGSFAPQEPISQSMIVMILARLVDVDLTQFANVTVNGAAPGMWYTEAAAWAQQSGILPDNSSFSSEGALTRDSMAIMLVKYMASMGIDTSAASSAATFADADQMTEAGQNAFQVLYQYGIFNGVGGDKMDPTGSTTRSQFAALVHRVSNFVTSK